MGSFNFPSASKLYTSNLSEKRILALLLSYRSRAQQFKLQRGVWRSTISIPLSETPDKIKEYYVEWLLLVLFPRIAFFATLFILLIRSTHSDRKCL
jgi:hypothetical protein